jgi:hypothetical protein
MKNFKLYNQTTVHCSTIKFSEFIKSINQIQTFTQQEMVGIRMK